MSASIPSVRPGRRTAVVWVIVKGDQVPPPRRESLCEAAVDRGRGRWEAETRGQEARAEAPLP